MSRASSQKAFAEARERTKQVQGYLNSKIINAEKLTEKLKKNAERGDYSFHALRGPSSPEGDWIYSRGLALKADSGENQRRAMRVFYGRWGPEHILRENISYPQVVENTLQNEICGKSRGKSRSSGVFFSSRGKPRGWSEPFRDKVSGKMLIRYAIPFFRNGKLAGEVFTDLSLHKLRRYMLRLKIGDSGYGVIISNYETGCLVYHPLRREAEDLISVYYLRTARSAGQEEFDPGLLKQRKDRLRSAFARSEPWSWDGNNALTGEHSRFFYLRLKNNWLLSINLIMDEIRLRGSDEKILTPKKTRRLIINISIVVFIFLALAFPLAVRPRLRRPRLWLFSYFYSLLILLEVLFIWRTAWRHPDPEPHETKLVLQEFSPEMRKELLNYDEDLSYFISVGVYLNAVSYQEGKELQLNGVLWEKSERENLPDNRPLVRFPDMVKGEFEKMYISTVAGRKTHIWRFSVQLRVNFSYEKFPLIRQNIWLRMAPRLSLKGRALLLPDLEGYFLLNPPLRPGLSELFTINGWNVERTFFSYRRPRYNAGLGLPDHQAPGRGQDLFYNIIVRKGIVDSFVSYMLPLAAIMTLLFTLLMVSSGRKRNFSLRGFSALNSLRVCGAFFLAIVFMHLELRTKFGGGLVFVEYFYMLAYLYILLVALNSLAIAQARIRSIIFAGNLPSRLIFWPSYLMLIGIISMYVFY